MLTTIPTKPTRKQITFLQSVFTSAKLSELYPAFLMVDGMSVNVTAFMNFSFSASMQTSLLNRISKNFKEPHGFFHISYIIIKNKKQAQGRNLLEHYSFFQFYRHKISGSTTKLSDINLFISLLLFRHIFSIVE